MHSEKEVYLYQIVAVDRAVKFKATFVKPVHSYRRIRVQAGFPRFSRTPDASKILSRTYSSHNYATVLRKTAGQIDYERGRGGGEIGMEGEL